MYLPQDTRAATLRGRELVAVPHDWRDREATDVMLAQLDPPRTIARDDIRQNIAVRLSVLIAYHAGGVDSHYDDASQVSEISTQ